MDVVEPQSSPSLMVGFCSSDCFCMVLCCDEVLQCTSCCLWRIELFLVCFCWCNSWMYFPWQIHCRIYSLCSFCFKQVQFWTCNSNGRAAECELQCYGPAYLVGSLSLTVYWRIQHTLHDRQGRIIFSCAFPKGQCQKPKVLSYYISCWVERGISQWFWLA